MTGSGFGDGGGLSSGVTMLGAAKALLCVAASHVICLYSSCTARYVQTEQSRILRRALSFTFTVDRSPNHGIMPA